MTAGFQVGIGKVSETPKHLFEDKQIYVVNLNGLGLLHELGENRKRVSRDSKY